MLVEKKILESERNQVYVKSNEGPRLNGSVTENKDVFDKFPQLIMNKYNELIDLLIASGLDTIADDFGNRYTKSQTDDLIEVETNSLVADIDIDLNTGIITVTKKDGTISTVDTALEKVPATFEFIEDTENDKFYIKITNVDGTSSQTEVTNLMNQYTFTDGDMVSFAISKSGTTTVVTASIKNGSIGFAQLNAEVKQYYEDIKSAVAADKATVAADKAVVLDASQTVTANTALVLSYKETAEENATLAKSYAIGNTGTRSGENTDNAKYYCNQAKTAENAANAIKTDVENAKKEALSSKEAAAQSALNAASSANNASASATAANLSKGAAALSESNALASKKSSEESAKAAQQSKEAAALSEVNALASKNSAEQSAATALEAQSAAETARDESRAIAWNDFITIIEYTMTASNWSDGQYSFETDYPSDRFDLYVGLNGSCTDEQETAFLKARIRGCVSGNIAIVKGTAPTVDIPVILEVVEK